MAGHGHGEPGHGHGGHFNELPALPSPTTANGFAQPYRAKIVVRQDKPELSGLDLDAEALRASLVARLEDLPEEPDAKS